MSARSDTWPYLNHVDLEVAPPEREVVGIHSAGWRLEEEAALIQCPFMVNHAHKSSLFDGYDELVFKLRV